MDRVKRQLGCSEDIQYGVATEEICVAVLDTGIGDHPDFEGRVTAFQDFVNDRQGSYDDSGHGTHVAGCIGGSGRLSGGRFSGIAPTCGPGAGKPAPYLRRDRRRRGEEADGGADGAS